MWYTTLLGTAFGSALLIVVAIFGGWILNIVQIIGTSGAITAASTWTFLLIMKVIGGVGIDVNVKFHGVLICM